MEFYEGRLFRPPSEARSLILQVTIGCSHNKCTFCYMYMEKKYRERDWPEIQQLVAQAAENYPVQSVRRIFLADGDSLAMDQNKLLSLLELLRQTFPNLQRVSAYTGPGNILAKTDQELKALKDAGLSIGYLGLESGHPQILANVNKGVTDQEMIKAGKKLKAAGVKVSLMVLSGLGGQALTKEHAKASAQAVNQICPDYLATLSLRFYKGTPLARQVDAGEFKPLTTMETLQELRWFVEDLDVQGCVFRSNHASNRLALSGTFNKDKQRMLSEIDLVLKEGDNGRLRPKHTLGL